MWNVLIDHVYLGCQMSKDIVDNYRSMFESTISAGAMESYQVHGNLTTWKVMQRNVWNDIANWHNRTTQQVYKVATPCIDDHQFKEEETKSVGELSKVCAQIVLKCMYLARIGRPDILRSVNKLARAFTKWTRACDKRFARLISYIHLTCEFKQYCHLGNTSKPCRLGLFQDSDFAGDQQDSKSTSGGLLCLFGSQTSVPISWMCKKQTSVSHSSTDAEIISLDAGLRMDGSPALDLWDLVIEVFQSSPNQLNNTKDQVQGNLSGDTTSNKHTRNQTKVPTQHDNFELNNVDCVPSNA